MLIQGIPSIWDSAQDFLFHKSRNRLKMSIIETLLFWGKSTLETLPFGKSTLGTWNLKSERWPEPELHLLFFFYFFLSEIYQSSFVIKSPKRCGQAAILSDLGLLHMPVKNLVYIFPFFSFDRMKILPKNLQIDRSSSLSRYLPAHPQKQNKKNFTESVPQRSKKVITNSKTEVE